MQANAKPETDMRADAGAPDRWTAEQVGEAVIEAFRALPSMPVYSPGRAEMIPMDPRQDRTPLNIVALTEHVLGRATPERRALLVWSRMKAARRIRADRSLRSARAVPGGSVTDHCNAFGINRRTFDRRRVRACEHVAAELNRIGDEATAQLDALRRTAAPLAEQVDRL